MCDNLNPQDSTEPEIPWSVLEEAMAEVSVTLHALSDRSRGVGDRWESMSYAEQTQWFTEHGEDYLRAGDRLMVMGEMMRRCGRGR
jgi:hypothetical protein